MFDDPDARSGNRDERFCPQCGQPSYADVDICSNCGSVLGERVAFDDRLKPSSSLRAWAVYTGLAILVAIVVAVAVANRGALERFLEPATPTPLTAEEMSWCDRNPAAILLAVNETDEVRLGAPGSGELFTFWTSDEWATVPRASWSDAERASYDRACRAAIGSR